MLESVRKLEWKFVYVCHVVVDPTKKPFEKQIRLQYTKRCYLKIFHLDCHQSEGKGWDSLNVLEKANTRKGRGVALQH